MGEVYGFFRRRALSDEYRLGRSHVAHYGDPELARSAGRYWIIAVRVLEGAGRR